MRDDSSSPPDRQRLMLELLPSAGLNVLGRPAIGRQLAQDRVPIAAHSPHNTRHTADDADQPPGPEGLACQALWYPDMFGNPTLADAILDRISYASRELPLDHDQSVMT